MVEVKPSWFIFIVFSVIITLEKKLEVKKKKTKKNQDKHVP